MQDQSEEFSVLCTVIPDLLPALCKLGTIDGLTIQMGDDGTSIEFELRKDDFMISCRFVVDGLIFDIGGCEWHANISDPGWVDKVIKRFKRCAGNFKPRTPQSSPEIQHPFPPGLQSVWRCDDCKYGREDHED